MIDRAPGGDAPCTCKWCRRQFTFVQGFTPSHDVCFCFYCGPLDVRKESERLIAEAQAKAGTE